MTAQQLTIEDAVTHRDQLLAEFARSVSDWDRALIEQAVRTYGADGEPFSMNNLRPLLPETAWGATGIVIRAMCSRRPAELVKVGEEPSTSAPTHGKPIGLYVLASAARRAA